jgi:hypothetical protein
MMSHKCETTKSSSRFVGHTRTIILIFFRDILHSTQAAHPLGGLPVLIVGI